MCISINSLVEVIKLKEIVFSSFKINDGILLNNVFNLSIKSESKFYL